MALIKKKKCRNCRELFPPNPKNAKHQVYCGKPECRKASKAESQRRWLQKPENRGYFTGSANVKRVQEWRKANPGYSQRKDKDREKSLQDNLELENLAKALEETLEPDNRSKTLQETGKPGIGKDALQDLLMTHLSENKGNTPTLQSNALQDLLMTQATVLIGLIANITGSTLQDEIDLVLQRMQNLGLDIVNNSTHFKGGRHDEKISHPPGSHPESSKTIQLGRSPAGS